MLEKIKTLLDSGCWVEVMGLAIGGVALITLLAFVGSFAIGFYFIS